MKLSDFLPSPASFIAGALCALLLGWWLWHPRPAPAEPPAAAVHLPGGALEIERKPDAPVPTTVRQAAKEAGGKLERAVSITVHPRATFGQLPTDAESVFSTPTTAGPVTALPSNEGVAPAMAAPGCSCAPITVDLGLVRMPDHSHRVVATARDGEIIGGIDIPLDMPAPASALHWAAGATYDAQHREYGAFLDRDLGPLRLGVEVQQRGSGVAAMVKAGIRW